MHVLNAIHAEIEQKGFISVADYMERCITHYYATRDPFGTQGDFTTAPEISQIFGELIGAWFYENWWGGEAILYEIGAGRGTLMKDILRATRKTDWHEKREVHIVENSPILTQIQHDNLKDFSIQWHKTFEAMPPKPLLLVANELFDALPIQQYVGEIERSIILKEGKLQFSPEGEVTRENSPASLALLDKILTHIKHYGGVALIIDYGYLSEQHKDTLQALKNHQCVDPLAEPGEADLTAHVDFLSLKQCTEKAGLQAVITTQGEFLRRLGAELRAVNLCKNANAEQIKTIISGVERLIHPEQMGSLFKVLAIGRFQQPPAGF